MTMRIYKNYEECMSAAKSTCDEYGLDYSKIERGVYRGGEYDCLFIQIDKYPETEFDDNYETIFEGAYQPW